MDHRKFNKPIELTIIDIDGYKQIENLTWIEQMQKKWPDYFKVDTSLIKKIIPDRRLSRSSYYRLLHLVDGKKALIEEPSSYTWDK